MTTDAIIPQCSAIRVIFQRHRLEIQLLFQSNSAFNAPQNDSQLVDVLRLDLHHIVRLQINWRNVRKLFVALLYVENQIFNAPELDHSRNNLHCPANAQVQHRRNSCEKQRQRMHVCRIQRAQ